MVLHSDVKNGFEKISSDQPEPISFEPVCSSHPSARAWRPLGQPTSPWLCEVCRPPPSIRMVGQWSDQGAAGKISNDGAADHRAGAPTLVAKPAPAGQSLGARGMVVTVAHPHPVCPSCKCRWTVEVYGGTTGGIDQPPSVSCWTCKRSISDNDLHTAAQAAIYNDTSTRKRRTFIKATDSLIAARNAEWLSRAKG